MISYRELERIIQTLKSELSGLDVKCGVVGVLLEEKTYLLPAVLLGLLHNNCLFYPMSLSGVMYTVDILKTVGVSHVLVHQELCEDLYPVLEFFQHKEKPSLTLQALDLKLFTIIPSNRPISGKLPSTDHQREAEYNDLAYCITTSGTTNKPKIVRVPHTCIVPNILHLREIFQLQPGDKVLMTSPLTFDPSIVDIFCTLSSGACLVMVPPKVKQMPERLLRVIHERQQITVMQATPSLMRTLGPGRLKQTLLGPDSNLRLLVLGGEQFPEGTELNTWLHPENVTQLYNLYGITEVSSWASCHKVDRTRVLQQGEHVPIGQALDKTMIVIKPLSANEETSEESKSGSKKTVGQILIGSSQRVCVIDDEQRSGLPGSEIIWRETGDLGTVDEDGNIFYLGRLDSQIKRNGKRFSLSVIEDVIKALPEVSSCCAVYHRSVLAVFVLLEPNADVCAELPQVSSPHSVNPESDFVPESVDKQMISGRPASQMHHWSAVAAKLHSHARQALPRHAMPDVFVEILEKFPVNKHGKLDRKELTKILDARKDISPCDLSPSVLQELWKAHLPVLPRQISDTDNFLSLGGDSLSAVRVALALQEVSSLSMGQIYDILLNKDFYSVLSAIKRAEILDNAPSKSASTEDKDKRLKLYENPTNDSPEYGDIHQELSFMKKTINTDNISHNSFSIDVESRNSPEAIVKSDPVSRSYLHKKNTAATKQVPVGTNVKQTENDINCAPCKSKQTKDMFTSDENDLFEKATKYKRNYSCCNGSSNSPTSILQKGGKIIFPDKYCNEKDKKCPREDNSPGKDSKCTADWNKSHNILPTNTAKEEREKLQLKRKWQFDTHKCVDASPLVIQFRSECSVFISSHSGLVSLLDLHSGACAWSVTLPDRVESSACCTLDGHFLVVGCYDGNIYILCVRSGARVWQFPTGDAVKCSPTLNPVSGHVLCGSHDGSLYCLDVQDQRCMWKRDLGGGSVFSSPAVNHDCQVVYAATLGGHVAALNAASGEVMWTIDLHKPVFSSLSVCDGKVLVGCVDCRLYCLEESGNLSWSFQAAGPIFSTPVVYGTHILFGCHDFCVYCLSFDGQLQWKFQAQTTIYATVFPFTVSVDKKCVQCRNTSTGVCDDKAMLKKFREASGNRNDLSVASSERNQHSESGKAANNTESSSKARDCDKRYASVCVAVASTDGNLSILDMRDGCLLVRKALPGQVFSSPVVANHCIVVGCRDNYVYSYELT
ncbi:acyl-CoA synthetase family member 4-like [Plakobranchus ocellatus]|uniref:Acyl-CoA synthetase family member 4-like n=1 Tax=Plakobranchus ocellatus TaxID=259542 RepID=A0AAV3ZHF3_9GAST|nr:acyl-CoA synthetase family member 4-like [Plakobranchus ocellatus]